MALRPEQTQKILIVFLVILLLVIMGVFLYSSFVAKEAPLPPTALDKGAVTTEYLKANGKTGDVVGISFMNRFHPRIQVIRIATGSRWMHVGILYRKPETNELFVAEAYNYIAPKKMKGARSQKGIQLVAIDEWFSIHVRKPGSGRLVGWTRLVNNQNVALDFKSLQDLLDATNLKTTVNLDILGWVAAKRKFKKKKKLQNSQLVVASELKPVVKNKKKYFCTEFVSECLYRLRILRPDAFSPAQSATSSSHDAYSPYECLKGLPLKQEFQWEDIKCVLQVA